MHIYHYKSNNYLIFIFWRIEYFLSFDYLCVIFSARSLYFNNLNIALNNCFKKQQTSAIDQSKNSLPLFQTTHHHAHSSRYRESHPGSSQSGKSKSSLGILQNRKRENIAKTIFSSGCPFLSHEVSPSNTSTLHLPNSPLCCIVLCTSCAWQLSSAWSSSSRKPTKPNARPCTTPIWPTPLVSTTGTW